MPFSNIDKPSKYFNTVLYTGTGASNARTGVGFQPDWVWIKERGTVANHSIYDAVRGVQKELQSSTTSAETTQAQGLTAFGSDGFTVGTLGRVNNSGATYVAWNWLASNTSGSSNTSGTITSTVAVNTTSGFSIVSYTGTGANATVGHGLGVAPKMVIIKNRTSAENWRVGHSGLTSWAFRLILDATSAQTSEPNAFNSTAPTSTVFSVGIDNATNQSTSSLIAYCFAEVKGFSKFGSYTGNGSTDGTFIYTGFKPAFILVKNITTSGEDWEMWDNARDPFNVTTKRLKANLSNAEATSTFFDFVSNGIKMRNFSGGFNASGATFIYMAFAENPFVSSKGIPTTAR